MIIATLVSVIFLHKLGNGSVNFSKNGFFSGLALQVLFYGISEMLPIMSFVHYNQKFLDIIEENNQENQEGD